MTAHPDNQRPVHKHTWTWSKNWRDTWNPVRTLRPDCQDAESFYNPPPEKGWVALPTYPEINLNKDSRASHLKTQNPSSNSIQILKHLFFFLWWRFEQEYEIPRQLSKVLLIPAHLTMNIKFPNIFIFSHHMHMFFLSFWYLDELLKFVAILTHLHLCTPEPWTDHHIHTLWRHYPCTLDTPIMRISSACLW